MTILSSATFAARVSVGAVMGDRAMISIDGSKARLMRAGESHAGVSLLEVRSDAVVIEQSGYRQTVRIGSSGSGRAAASPTGPAQAVLHADSGGHFTASGLVNGLPVNFLVDTGASVVALPKRLAQQAGVSLAGAQRAMIRTANGNVAAQRVFLNSLQVGGITLNMVEAVVVEEGLLPVALLGMSFLNRTDMRSEGQMLTLTQRY